MRTATPRPSNSIWTPWWISSAAHPTSSESSSSGASAIAQYGWLRAHRWLLARRASQLFFLGIFLLGPVAGIWLVKGNLASSLTLDILPLSDPYVLLQSLFAGHLPEATALLGALIVLAIYATIGGRVYCAWVCPVNPITDFAHWLRTLWPILPPAAQTGISAGDFRQYQYVSNVFRQSHEGR